MPGPQLRPLHLAPVAALIFLVVSLLTPPGATTALAGHRPVPLMDFVPQEAGVYDTYHTNLTEQDCRSCHGLSTAERHHSTPSALSGSCNVCHEAAPPPDYGFYITRNCLTSACHNAAAGSPHHTGAEAQAMQCTACHNPQLVGAFWGGSDPAQDPPRVSPPTPYSCENCHWPQPLAGMLPSTDQHYGAGGVLQANAYFSEAGFALQPLEMGVDPGDNGWLYPKPIMGDQGTHHVGGLYHDCTNCHAFVDGYPGPDPSDPLLIRYCERCHTKESLHAVKGHVEPFEGVTGPGNASNASAWEAAEVSGTTDASLYRPFGQQERCAGCHVEVPLDAPPAPAGLPPCLQSISPESTEPGGVPTVSGGGFGSSFAPGGHVQVKGDGTGGLWLDLPPVTWSDTQLRVLIPDWLLPEGNFRLRVVTPLGASNERALSRMDCTCGLMDLADAVDPAGLNGDLSTHGPLYSKVTVTGTMLGLAAAGSLSGAGDSAGVNYFEQILLEPVGDGFTLIIADPALRSGSLPNPRASISGTPPAVVWAGTSVEFKLNTFWQDTDGNYRCDGEAGSGENIAVPVTSIPPGLYSLQLRRVHWKDWNGNGVFDQPNPQEPADPANEALLVTFSDALSLTISSEPYIKEVRPPLTAANKAVLAGINFGASQNDSTVNVYKKDGFTLVKRLTAGSLKIRLWSATKVKFIVPGVPGQVRWVSVTVGGKESNKVKVKLL